MRVLQLVKQIVSKQGAVHFRRWAIWEAKWCSLYVHQICRSDEEKHPHDHPWAFVSLILRGGYQERLWRGSTYDEKVHKPGSVLFRGTRDFHRIKLLGNSAWTLVLTGPRSHELWGYKTDRGWVDHVTYRKQKNA